MSTRPTVPQAAARRPTPVSHAGMSSCRKDRSTTPVELSWLNTASQMRSIRHTRFMRLRTMARLPSSCRHASFSSRTDSDVQSGELVWFGNSCVMSCPPFGTARLRRSACRLRQQRGCRRRSPHPRRRDTGPGSSLWQSSPRTMRTGEELRVSGAVSTASGAAKPGSCRSRRGHGLLQRVGELLRQHVVQVARGERRDGRSGGYRPAAADGRCARKSPSQLRRRVIVRAAEAEGRPARSAPARACRRAAPGSGKSSGCQRDQQGSVGVFAAARGIAHAVRDDAAGLRGRGDHMAAGAHAECIGRRRRPAGARRAYSRPGGSSPGAARRTARGRSRACGCSMRTPMENGFGSMGIAGCVQPAERVAGAVADGENDIAACKRPLCSASSQTDSP